MYVTKILNAKQFDLTTSANKPVPMSSTPEYIWQLDTTSGPDSEKEKQQLEQRMGFKYRAATGELLFSMVTCQPDISNAVIKLTQFNANPAACHYDAVVQVYKNLHETKNDGLTYWHTQAFDDLPHDTIPLTQPEEYHFQTQHEHDTADKAYVLVDSDLAGNIKSRRSVGGIAIMMTGAAIEYKTILQRTVALSSTEAEFYALSEASKLTLYV